MLQAQPRASPLRGRGIAALVGYSSGLQLSELAISSSVWQHIYAVIGAVSVGGTALVRLGAPMAGSDGAHRG